MALEPDVRLGPYEIVELRGKGGMGEVYRARGSTARPEGGFLCQMSLRLKIDGAAPTGVLEWSDAPAWIDGRVKIAERATDASPTFRSK